MDLIVYSDISDLYSKCETIRERSGATKIAFVSIDKIYGFWQISSVYPTGGYEFMQISDFKDELSSLTVSYVHFLGEVGFEVWELIDLSVFVCICHRCKDISVNYDLFIPLNLKKILFDRYNKEKEDTESNLYKQDSHLNMTKQTSASK